MWKRFKNWLIKKLGGYTKSEYDMREFNRPMLFDMVQQKCVTLAYERVVCKDAFRTAEQAVSLDRAIKDDLTRDILRAVPAYIEFEYLDCFDPCIRATLRIMKEV